VTVLHFVSGTVLTINARNYVGNLLFANYYTAVYSVVTATHFTWYSSICRNTPNGHRIPFPVWSVCVPNSDPPPVKISQIQPCVHPEMCCREKKTFVRLLSLFNDVRSDSAVKKANLRVQWLRISAGVLKVQTKA